MTEIDHAQDIVFGVTGHRVLAEIETLTEGIDSALRHLAAACGHQRLRILSCLAEGADRLVAERAMAGLGASLSALLPMNRESYMEPGLTAGGSRETERGREKPFAPPS